MVLVGSGVSVVHATRTRRPTTQDLMLLSHPGLRFRKRSCFQHTPISNVRLRSCSLINSAHTKPTCYAKTIYHGWQSNSNQAIPSTSPVRLLLLRLLPLLLSLCLRPQRSHTIHAHSTAGAHCPTPHARWRCYAEGAATRRFERWRRNTKRRVHATLRLCLVGCWCWC
jgi:hypothetical protein